MFVFSIQVVYVKWNLDSTVAHSRSKKTKTPAHNTGSGNVFVKIGRFVPVSPGTFSDSSVALVRMFVALTNPFISWTLSF